MAKQTINIGASPNDGTGTPLRTAFDYTNQNFTELYTATGPSGNNIVVPGSATISGDLTVDTSTLKVDSANNRVGIRTASPTEPLTIDNTSGVTTGGIRVFGNDQANSRIAVQNNGGQAYHLVAGEPGVSNNGFALYDNTAAATRLYVDNTGVQTWRNVGGVAGTAMTLNSTGLGVGVSPAFKIHANGVIGTTNTFGAFTALQTAGGTGYRWTLANDNNFYLQYSPDGFGSTATSRIALDSSGNVGIGVTPSAYGTGIKGLDIGAWTSTAQIGAASFYGFNSYASTTGQFNYKNSGAIALGYFQTTSGHLWLNAPSNAGAAGANATFTTVMTLDPNGNLILLPPSTPPTLATNGQLTVNATSNTNLRFSYRGSDGVTRVANLTLA